MRAWLLALAALLWSGQALAGEAMRTAGADDKPFELAQVSAPGPYAPGHMFNAPGFGPFTPTSNGPANLAPSALLISDDQLCALGTTDYGANCHLISDGWTFKATLHATTDASPTFAHYAGFYQPSYASPLSGVLPTPSSNALSFTDTRPGYVCTPGLGANCAPTTFATTVYGTVPLRQPFGVSGVAASYGSPITGVSGADLMVSGVWSDPVFNGDSAGAASFAAGFYNYDGSHPSPSATVTPTAGSEPNYPPPIMSWVTPPGRYFSSAAGITVEVNCISGMYGPTQTAQAQACAGVTVTASDGTHSVPRTTATMVASLLQVSGTGTATNGSNCITGMASTDGFNVGDRVTVYGVPAIPTILSKTSSQLCLGEATTATFTTGLPGTITLLAPATGNGQAFADGAFVGASIQSVGAVNITSGSGIATINASANGWSFVSADLTQTGANPHFATAAVLHTNATATVAGTAQAVNILENYQGVTGTVTVYKGVPHYDYQLTFTPTDFSGTITTAGNISFEAIGYPQYGNNPTDSRWGAGAMNVPGDGAPSGTGHTDGCDWFAVNLGSCGGAALFNVNGTDISPNLHNLWANDDTNYSPLYCYIGTGGTGTTTATACNTTGIAPTSANCGTTTACAASPFALLASIKAYNAARHTTSDLNGAVMVYVSTGSPITYTGFGGVISSAITVKKPGIVITSVTSGGTVANPYGVAASDPANVTLGYSSAANNTLAGTNYVNNLTISSGTSAPIQGLDSVSSTTFPAYEDVFNNIVCTPTIAQPMIYRVGSWHILNSQINQGSFEGNCLTVNGGQPDAMAELAFSTAVLGKYNVLPTSIWTLHDGFGNVLFNGGPVAPNTTATNAVNPQTLSSIYVDNRIINYLGSGVGQNSIPVNQVLNFAYVNNECEYVEAVSPCLYYGADNSFTPMYNVVDMYNTEIGARASHHFAEGAALNNYATALTGGALTNATKYYFATTLSNPGGTTEDAYDSLPAITNLTTGACTVANTCSITVILPPITLPGAPEGVRKAFFYLSTTVIGSGSTTRALVNNPDGSACTQPCTIPPAGGKFTLTGVDSATGTLPTLNGQSVLPSPWVGWGALRMREVEHFNIRGQDGLKNDTYAFNASAWGSGGRIGTWDGMHGVSKIGNATTLGNVIQGVAGGTGPLGSTGMYAGWGSQPSTANSTSNITFASLAWKQDNSCGWSSITCGVAPAGSPNQYGLNLGDSDICLLHTSPAGLALVPNGYGEWPIDVHGVTRHGDGTGTAGAVEGNDTGSGGAAQCY